MSAVVHQVAARCLAYPDEEFFAELPLLRSALEPAHPLCSFLDHAEAAGPQALAAEYVEVFDFTSRRCLYLTWWTDGDTRRRGMSLVRFKEAYRAHGLTVSAEELPDFLPVVLEFTAATGSDELLLAHRPAVELLRISLAEHGTPYAAVLDALCATLPGPSPKDRAAARAMARPSPPATHTRRASPGTPFDGPPVEYVGLEPYGLLPVLDGGQP